MNESYNVKKVDAENKIVKLCAEGIEAEMRRDMATAVKCYTEAWNARTNDYEACIAAHYMARLEDAAAIVLHWNMLALEYAEKVAYEEVAMFYPSLYLNIGKSYEDMGQSAEALKYYSLGIEKAGILPADRLGTITRDALVQRKQNIENNLPAAV